MGRFEVWRRWVLSAAVASLALGGGFCALGQVADGTAGGQVELAAHDGKTKFYMGERIQVDLVFRPGADGKPITVNATDYGDLSDKVEISPAKGWIQWRGVSGHDYSVASPPITSGEFRIPVVVNEGFIFRQAGHYEVRVTTGRMGGPVRTNAVGIDVQEMPADREAAEVRSLVAEISSAANSREGNAARAEAVGKLAALGGDDALRAKIRMMRDSDDDMRRETALALASTRNLELELQLLQAAWNDVSRPPFYDLEWAMQQTRSLLRGETEPGWTMALALKNDEASRRAATDHSADMDALIRSLPLRTGESRSFATYLLFQDHGLTPAQVAAAKPVVIEDFPFMDNLEQRMLLETGWKEVKDVALVPALKGMLDATKPGKMGDPNDAIKRLVELDPEAAKPYVVRAVCDAGNNLQLTSVAAMPQAVLPEVDDCLSATLAEPWTRATQNQWKWKAELAARFATAKVIPALRKGWTDKSRDGVALAILLRWEPVEALAYLKTHEATEQETFYEINRVFKARRASFPAELRAWLRDEVRDGADRAAGYAAYELSQSGLLEDREVIEARLKKMWSAWAADPTLDEKVVQQRTMVESGFMSALRGTQGSWYMTNAKAAELARGCMFDECRGWGKPRNPDAPFPEAD